MFAVETTAEYLGVRGRVLLFIKDAAVNKAGGFQLNISRKT